MNTPSPVTLLKALADPTRIRLLALLATEELAVSELTSLLGMAQSRVSSHLAVLREAGLARDRRQGTSAYYSAASDGPEWETWLAVRETLPVLEETRSDLRRLAEVLALRQERGREFFDRMAADWDDGRSESLGNHAGMFALAGLLPPQRTILDLGTGTGGFLPRLAGRVDHVIAVDYSRGMLRRAGERVTQGRSQGVQLVRGEAGRLPLPDRAVEGVVANMVLHHLKQPGETLREIARVLRPGGRVVIVDFEAHDETWLLREEGHRWAGFDPAQLAGWCVDAGLGVPQTERVPTPQTARWNRLNVFVASTGRPPTTSSQRETRPERTHKGKETETR